MERNYKNQAEEALNSFDGIQRAVPAPFFFTRLNARLTQSEKNVWENFGSFISRPVVAFATVCLILMVNITVLVKKTSSANPAFSEQNEQTLNNAYDVTASTNSTILNIWEQENE